MRLKNTQLCWVIKCRNVYYSDGCCRKHYIQKMAEKLKEGKNETTHIQRS